MSGGADPYRPARYELPVLWQQRRTPSAFLQTHDIWRARRHLQFGAEELRSDRARRSATATRATMFDYRDATALITGASSGIGEAFAVALAARGTNLILVARTKPKLEALAQRLAKQHGIRATAIEADLTDPAAAQRIRASVDELGLRVDLLVNNAGFGRPFLAHDLAHEPDQICVDVGAVVDVVALTHLFAREMVARRTGGVINLASITSFLPMPYSAVYGASKSFVLSFSEGLGREAAAAGVHVLAVCPGPVATRFYDQLGAKPPRQALDTPERIVADALNAFDRRRSVVVPGRFRIQALIFGTRLLPRAIDARIGEMITRRCFLTPKRG
jgi:short-subunit dehydrogenase